MSRESVELVTGMLRAWGVGDRERARAAFDEHVVFIYPGLENAVSHGVRSTTGGSSSTR
jgi:hypothetical protein